MKDMNDRIQRIVSGNFNVSNFKILPESSLKEDLMLDSLDLVDLILLLEREFNVQVSDEDIYQFLTVGQISEYIEHKISNKPLTFTAKARQ